MALESGGGGGRVVSRPKGGTPVLAPTRPTSAQQLAAQQRLNAKSQPPTTHWASQPNSQTGPAAVSGGTGGGTGGGGGGMPGGYSVASNIAPPQINPSTDYLQEAGYMANISALDKALQEFNSQDTAERGRYDVDYKEGLRGLGYRDENIDDTIEGDWDFNDQLTASGRGYQQNLNDFASRGMLESQGYYDSVTNLKRSLADQLGAMTTGRQNFKKERDEGVANYGNQDQAARATAMTAAIERLSAQLGLT